jgi:hypothetical protein
VRAVRLINSATWCIVVTAMSDLTGRKKTGVILVRAKIALQSLNPWVSSPAPMCCALAEIPQKKASLVLVKRDGRQRAPGWEVAAHSTVAIKNVRTLCDLLPGGEIAPASPIRRQARLLATDCRVNKVTSSAGGGNDGAKKKTPPRGGSRHGGECCYAGLGSQAGRSS